MIPSHRPWGTKTCSDSEAEGTYPSGAMLFDPNRWPKPYPMIGSLRRFAIGIGVLVSVGVLLIIILPALAD
jgi:hypothetical protein